MTARRRRAHAACAEYLRLRGQLWLVPPTDPARPTIALAIARAERRWRTLATATQGTGHTRQDAPQRANRATTRG